MLRDDNQCVAAAMLRQRVLSVALVEGERLSADKQRSVWVHETLKKRLDHGEYHQLVQELLLHHGRLQYCTYPLFSIQMVLTVLCKVV